MRLLRLRENPFRNVRSWIPKAIAQAELPAKERLKLSRASTHWLRHTFGTRGVTSAVPVDVMQAQMGHSSSAITTSLYRRALLGRRAGELQKAFNQANLRIVLRLRTTAYASHPNTHWATKSNGRLRQKCLQSNPINPSKSIQTNGVIDTPGKLRRQQRHAGISPSSTTNLLPRNCSPLRRRIGVQDRRRNQQ